MSLYTINNTFFADEMLAANVKGNDSFIFIKGMTVVICTYLLYLYKTVLLFPSHHRSLFAEHELSPENKESIA